MSILKRITALMLVLCMSVLLSATAFALEVSEPDVRVEDAVVDVSCFTDEALTYVESYVVENDAGQFYITDEATLQNLLTRQQYTLVVEQIRIVNECGNAPTRPATGSSSNPYELTEGVSTSVSASDEYWFKCATWGATDFTMRSTRSATMIIYKKTLFGKTLLNSYSNTTYQTKLISDCTINNGKTTYLLSITPSATATLTARIAQHTDSNVSYCSTGAMWEPYSQSAIPDSNVLFFKYWYLPADYVDTLHTYISHRDFLDYQTRIVNGTLTAARVAAAVFGNGDWLSKATGVIAKVAKVLVSVDFKQSVLDEIDECGGYNEATNEYTQGVLLIEYMGSGFTFYEVHSWNGSTMYGPDGWTGTWTPNEA